MTRDEFNNKTKESGFCFMEGFPDENADFLECDTGWYGIIVDICDELNKAHFTGKVTQIKEKFGGLRFYTDYIGDQWEVYHDIIEKHCAKSLHTCEMCGGRGAKNTTDRYWIKTLCAECNATRLMKEQ